MFYAIANSNLTTERLDYTMLYHISPESFLTKGIRKIKCHGLYVVLSGYNYSCIVSSGRNQTRRPPAIDGAYLGSVVVDIRIFRVMNVTEPLINVSLRSFLRCSNVVFGVSPRRTA